jgi:hypothetical protein
MALVLSGSIDISGSMTATTILVSSPGAAGMVSSSAQITELAPLMAYTASLKGAAIVSSSQQVQNYFTFAQTASANTFYGNQSISGTITATTSTTGATIKLGGFTNYGTIQDVNDVRRIWFENVGSYRTIFDLPVSGSSFAFRTNEGTSLFNVNSGSGASVGTGDLTITNGNLVMASGKGIDFSANSNAAGMTSELLNDYEEGTWTPVITDLTNDATMDGTFSLGSYTKIGRQVTVRGYVLTTSLGSVTGNVKIKGLPFANGGGFASLGGGSIGTADGLNITAGHSVHISTPLGQSYLGINVGDSATGTTEMTAAEWSADGQVQFLATYFV